MITKKDKLPKRIKDKWIKALRSGVYKQGDNYLYEPENNTYCCLGVLALECGIINEDIELEQNLFNLNYTGKIPNSLLQETIYKKEIKRNSQNTIHDQLVNMNDGNKNLGVEKKTFKQIAAWIQRNL